MITFTQGCYTLPDSLLPATTYKWTYINEQVGMKIGTETENGYGNTFATVRAQKSHASKSTALMSVVTSLSCLWLAIVLDDTL